MAKGEGVRGNIKWISMLIGLGVVVSLTALYLSPVQFLEVLEFKVFDSHFRLRGSYPPGKQIAIVAIDEKSLARYGRWPWPRSILAALIDKIQTSGARTIGMDIILTEPEKNQQLSAAEGLRQRYQALGLTSKGKEGRDFYREIGKLVKKADNDAALAGALRKADNVVLPLFFTFQAEEAADRKEDKRIPLGKASFLSFGNYSQRKLFPPISAGWVTVPLDILTRQTKALGHVNIIPDSDGTVRWGDLVVEYKGEYYPSFPLQVARNYLGVPVKEMKLVFGQNVLLGESAIPVNEQGRLLINYAGGIRSFDYYSVADVLEGKVPQSAFKDMIVLIGATAVGIYDLRVTPFSPVFPGVELHANVIANIINGRFLRRPNWLGMVDLAAIALLGLGLAGLIIRLRPITGAALGLGAAVAYFGLSHFLFVSTGVWLRFFYPLLAISSTYFGVTVLRLFTEEKQRRFIKAAFQHYVSQEVVEEIVKDPRKLRFGGERKVLTVLFADMRGFTAYSEMHPPEEVVSMLHDYLSAMVEKVFKHGGTVDKFIGDAVMAIWGAPIEQEEHALMACRCALDMIQETEKLNANWQALGRRPFTIGIGINSGEMVVGNLGSSQRFDFTVIGDNVNLAARLEAANKEYDTKLHIIISEFTYRMLKEQILARPITSITARGKTRPVTIYELLGERN